MNHQMIRIGRIFKIPVGLDYSWFFIEIIVAWMLATGYFPHEFPGWSPLLYWSAGILTSLLLFASVLLHEIGHALIARLFKIEVKNIRLLIFGGVAQFEKEPEKAAPEFWIAAAGPLVNLILAALLYSLLPLLAHSEVLSGICKYLAYINLILGLFNLIPGFPLDGGRVLRAIFLVINHDFRKSTLMAASIGRVIGFLFIIWGFMLTVNASIMDGLWLIFIGWFLDTSASAQIQRGNLRTILMNYQVKDAMNPNYAVIPGDESVKTLMDYHIIGEGRRYIVVEEDKQPVGLLTLHHVRHIPREHWADLRVRDSFLPFSQLRTLTPQTNLWDAFNEMQSDGVNQLPVIENGKLVGILSREDLLSYLKRIEDK